jgi:hypothetical protein
MTDTDTTTDRAVVELLRRMMDRQDKIDSRVDRLERAIVEQVRETVGNVGTLKMWNRAAALREIVEERQGPVRPTS